MTEQRYSRGCLLLPRADRVAARLFPALLSRGQTVGLYLQANFGMVSLGCWTDAPIETLRTVHWSWRAYARAAPRFWARRELS